MFTIGDFAGLGRLSVRMLRHYDAIGLLTPARVDPATGYRYYTADQLRRLNRIIALKDLGFTLSQVREILDEKVDTAQLRGMLRLRQAQLAEQLAADSSRLARVEARLRMIESEGLMSTEDVVLKSIPSMRVAELSAICASYGGDDITPVLSPLYPELFKRMEAAGITMTGAPIAYYVAAPEESADAVRAHAACPVAVEPSDRFDFDIVDLPAIPAAATIVHRGPMANVDASMQLVARWIDENGYTAHGPFAREVYLDCPPDQADWVTEMQLPVTTAA